MKQFSFEIAVVAFTLKTPEDTYNIQSVVLLLVCIPTPVLPTYLELDYFWYDANERTIRFVLC